MRILDMALKDIRQIIRDKRSLLFLLVMPVVFTYFFGFAFSSGNGENGDSRLLIGVINRDSGGILTSTMLELLESSETVRPMLVDEADSAGVDSQVVREELAAVLVIPADFSEGTLSGREPQLEMIINEETTSGQTARRALQTTITRAMSIAQAARMSLNAYETEASALNDENRADYLADAVSRAAQHWKVNPLRIAAASAANPKARTDPLAVNPFNQFSPGMIVQFAFFGLIQAASVVVVERKNGAMARLLTTPMKKAELIAGHILSMFMVFFVQQLLLIIFGQFVLNVDYFREPLAILLVAAALSLWVASAGLLVSALVKKEDQVVLFAMIGMFVFSALGGSWFSLEMVGGTFAAIGHLTPAAWAIDGFQNIIVRGLGLESVLLPVAIVLAYAAAFFGVAVWRFKFE